MIEDRFRKLCFKAGMPLNYQTKRMESPVLCALIAVHLDNECVLLIPVDTEEWEPQEFWTSIETIELPPRELKVIKP